MKKQWKTLSLIVLFKGRPEETLLCHCKHKTAPPVAPYNHKDNCTSNPTCCRLVPTSATPLSLAVRENAPLQLKRTPLALPMASSAAALT